MKVLEYAKLAPRTLNDLGTFEDNIMHMDMGLVDEIGESISCIKKTFAYGKEFDMANFSEELGDIMWFATNKSLLIAIEAGQATDENMEALFPEILDKDVKDLFESEGMPKSDAPANEKRAFCTKALFTLNSAISGNPTYQDIASFHGVGLIVKGCAMAMGLDFNKILNTNIEKLKVRFPDKFDADMAIVRDLKAERKVLED